ncbi:MAG: hypothetical protein KJI71_04375 [Patescibacteria group bacterium]|nr:hypothetical protein [Patescibacteria group bacterium]
MEKKKVAIIGIGGRTGTMFAFELRKSAHILSVGREKEVKMIEEKKLYVNRNNLLERFDGRVVKDIDFQEEPDMIFLTVKNPVSPAIKYYFQRFRGNTPTLLISQNGISAISDAKETLKEIFGKDSEKIGLIRVIIFNPIDRKQLGDELHIKYSLPIRIALTKVSGGGDTKDIVDIFKEADFKVTEFSQEEAKNLEYSKLFLNLIGMASASRGFSVREGFRNKEIFREEIGSLREYVKAVKLSGGKFLNFPYYPVNFLASIFSSLPVFFLTLFRNILAKIVSKGRGEKKKDLDEIEYYNGAVVNLGKRVEIKTPFNENIYKRSLEKLRKI